MTLSMHCLYRSFAMNGLKRSVPYIVVFTTSMGIMILELVASRLVSKYFGNSLYTWTGVIGVVLGGISLGNFLGGRLADRFNPGTIIAPLLLASSFLTFLILALDLLLEATFDNAELSIITSAMVLRSFMAIVILFFLPSASLGTISPVMAKYALQQSSRVGNTVGSIYALSAAGSILGTFLSGYLLIPLLGIKTIIFLVGGVMAFLAVTMGGYRILSRRYRILSAVWLCLIGLLYLLSSRMIYPGEAVLYAKDTQYSHMKVKDIPRAGKQVRILIMDGLIHNMYDPDRPDDLLYEYEKIFLSLTESYLSSAGSKGPFRSLTLGGGGCVFPAYLDRHFPKGRHEVVEIDPEVIRIAQAYFDVPRGLNVVIADARNYITSVQHGQEYDLVFLDAFNSFSVPYHLTTEEFTRAVSSCMSPDGIFLANCVDILSVGGFLAAYLNTVEAVFPYVSVYVTPDAPYEKRSTFVVAASFRGMKEEELKDARGEIVGRRLSPGVLSELKARRGGLVLRDDFAPVENLMAPVFLKSVD